jgi:hypothetical protein
MRGLFSACALAISLAVPAYAQDNTVKSKTKVKADDARTVVMTGCLSQSAGGYMLSATTAAAGEDLTVKSRVKTDVDKDETTVKTRTDAEIDRDDRDPIGTSGIATMYMLAPRAGVNLAAHVGHRVEIAGVLPDPAKGDDDAEVTIREDTKVENDDAPDGRIRTKTKAELPRGPRPHLAVVSVKPLSGSCPAY